MEWGRTMGKESEVGTEIGKGIWGGVEWIWERGGGVGLRVRGMGGWNGEGVGMRGRTMGKGSRQKVERRGVAKVVGGVVKGWGVYGGSGGAERRGVRSGGG